MNNLNDCKLKLYCEKCNFQAIRPAEWTRHIQSNKHIRDGYRLPDECEICNKTFQSHFFQKMHMLSIHATQEERKEFKYYCNICDTIFKTKSCLDKHTTGKKHIKLEKNINETKK